MLRATFLVLASWGAAPRFAQNGSPKPAPTARPDERCGEVWQTWWRGRASNGAARDPWATAPSDAGEWRAAPESLGFWERWRVPALADFDGMVWFRVSARLGPDQAAQAATLSLGTIDEIDQTWLPLDSGEATRVRFCWADAPVCTLYDRSGLPAGPFELPIQ